jgi:hypothetical protein
MAAGRRRPSDGFNKSDAGGMGMRFKWAAVIALALVAAPAFADENIWNIGPRTLTPPANASPELQAIIGDEHTPKVMHGAHRHRC